VIRRLHRMRVAQLESPEPPIRTTYTRSGFQMIVPRPRPQLLAEEFEQFRRRMGRMGLVISRLCDLYAGTPGRAKVVTMHDGQTRVVRP
jgi:hypothetical protein